MLFKKRRIPSQNKSSLKNRTETTKKQFLQLRKAAISTSAVKVPMKFSVENYNVINHGTNIQPAYRVVGHILGTVEKGIHRLCPFKADHKRDLVLSSV